MRLVGLLAAAALLAGCQSLETSQGHRAATEQLALASALAGYAERVSALDSDAVAAERQVLATAPDDAEAGLKMAILLIHPAADDCDVKAARDHLTQIADQADADPATRDLARLLKYFTGRATCEDPERLTTLLVGEQRQRLQAQEDLLAASKEVVRTRAEMRALREKLAALKSLEEQIMQRESPPPEQP